MEPEDAIYAGGIESLLGQRAQKRTPWIWSQDTLPPVNADLDALREQTIDVPTQSPADFSPQDFRSMTAVFEAELQGQNRLILLHAQLIALLQRDAPPPQTEDLFHRLWAEQGAFMADHLDTHWQVAAASTFADHGRNSVQTALGMGLLVMFDMIRLHDTERRLTGRPLEVPFRKRATGKLQRLSFDMMPFSQRVENTDRALLTRLWELSARDPVMQPLARAMLGKAMSDRRSIFARFENLRSKRPQPDEPPPEWAVTPPPKQK